MRIEIKKLNKTYEDGKVIFNDFNLDLYDDAVNCIIGQSGCGKSTLLNILAGILKKNSGSIYGCNKEVVSYIFQEDRLIEWLTIGENLELALKRYYKRDLLKNKIEEILKLTEVEDCFYKYPSELSGGMKQRVNIARAIGKPSKVILMDEPFKSLDYKIKYSIIDKFKEIVSYEKRMVIMITHDLDEAVYFQGNIIVLGGNPVKVKGIFKDNLQLYKNDILKLI